MNANQREWNPLSVLRIIRVHWRPFAVQWRRRVHARGLTASGSRDEVMPGAHGSRVSMLLRFNQ